MASSGSLAGKLQDYFCELTPGMRAMLVAALVREGDRMPHGDMILGALRAAMRRKGERQDEHDIAALVLQPCEAFTIPDAEVAKASGIILQDSLKRVWNWLERDRIAADIEDLRAAIDRDLLGRALEADVERVRQAAVAALEDVLGEEGPHDDLSRIRRHIGSERAAEDIRDIAVVLRHHATLETFRNNLEVALRLPADELMPALKSELDALHRKARTAFPFGLAILKSRLGTPLALLRFTVAASGSSSDERLRDSSYGAAISLLFADIDRAVSRAQIARMEAAPDNLVAAIREFGTVLRALFSEIEMDSRGPWSRRIATQRKAMGEAVRVRLSDLTPRVSQLMSMRESKRSALKFDEHELARLDADIAILMTARIFAEEIALNAETTRVQGEVRDLLESGTSQLIERMRKLPANERGPVRERLDAISRISARVFGEEYAHLVRKSVHVIDAAEKTAKAASKKQAKG